MNRMKTKCVVCGLLLHGWKEVGDNQIRFPRGKTIIGKEFIHNGKHGYAHSSCIKKVKEKK